MQCEKKQRPYGKQKSNKCETTKRKKMKQAVTLPPPSHRGSQSVIPLRTVAAVSTRSRWSRSLRWLMLMVPIVMLAMWVMLGTAAVWGAWLALDEVNVQSATSYSHDNDEMHRQFTGEGERPAVASSEHRQHEQQSVRQRQRQQRLVILAGPHKTGTSSMQTNLWRWTSALHHTGEASAASLAQTQPSGHTRHTRHTRHTHKQMLSNWVWAVPPQIIQIESSDPHPWQWTPSKGFYPLLEALRNYTLYPHALPTRTLFRNHTARQIQHMYSTHLNKVWTEGHDIVMGTEAMDSLVKDRDGVAMLHTLVRQVLPFAAAHHTAHLTPTDNHPTRTPPNVTIVIVYRTPKHKHLLSIWHQNALTRTSPGFYDWITTTLNELGALDALGMTHLILANTPPHWNVVLLDTSGVQEEGWDISTLVACRVLEADCDHERRQVLGMAEEDGGEANPVLLNVREDRRPVDVEDGVLQEMEAVLREYDCRYRRFFGSSGAGGGGVYGERLRVLHPLNLPLIMEACDAKNRTQYISRKAMKEQIVQIAVKGGKKDL